MAPEKKIKVDLSKVPPHLVRWAEQQARLQNISLDEVVSMAMKQYLDRQDRKQQ